MHRNFNELQVLFQTEGVRFNIYARVRNRYTMMNFKGFVMNKNFEQGNKVREMSNR